MTAITLDCSSLEPAPTVSQETTKAARAPTSIDEISLTLYYAVEIERSVASTLWHYPEYLGLVQRELDPNIHFTVPACRFVLEAIGMAGQKCSAADWASVLECICEIPGAFEECGGKEGLNTIFTDENRFPWGVSEAGAEPILRDHIRFLKAAAVIRGVDPSKPVEHYAVGWGHLTKNKAATKPEHPCATGTNKCPYCGKIADLAAWQEGERLKLKATPQRRRAR